MSNPFDKKIKESLENFEMPYDASAWAAFEKQLPPSAGTATTSSQFGWKLVALLAVVATVATSIWYFNSDNESDRSEKLVIEQAAPAQEGSISETSSTELTEEVTSTEESNKITNTEKTQTTRTKTATPVVSDPHSEATNNSSEDVTGAADSQDETAEKKAKQSSKKTPVEKTDVKPLVVRFAASSLSVCAGEEVRFTNESSDLKTNMVWDFGDGADSDELHPTHVFPIPGDYSVKLKAENGAKSVDKTLNITVRPKPTATLEASQKLSGYDAIPYYHFETALQPDQTAQWTFTDGSVVDGEVADHLFRDAGKSEATLTVKNSFGCTSTNTWQVENRKSFQLLAPTGFSPDGDGRNDEFMPGALADMHVDFEMVILDQKGQELFRTASASDPWNGRMQNHGNKLDAGVYVWTVVLKDDIVRKKTFTGTITILP